MRSSEKFAKEHAKPIDPSLDGIIEPLEFLFSSLPLTRHYIGIG
jgi:hypothetical protein